MLDCVTSESLCINTECRFKNEIIITYTLNMMKSKLFMFHDVSHHVSCCIPSFPLDTALNSSGLYMLIMVYLYAK